MEKEKTKQLVRDFTAAGLRFVRVSSFLAPKLWVTNGIVCRFRGYEVEHLLTNCHESQKSSLSPHWSVRNISPLQFVDFLRQSSVQELRLKVFRKRKEAQEILRC